MIVDGWGSGDNEGRHVGIAARVTEGMEGPQFGLQLLARNYTPPTTGLGISMCYAQPRGTRGRERKRSVCEEKIHERQYSSKKEKNPGCKHSCRSTTGWGYRIRP